MEWGSNEHNRNFVISFLNGKSDDIDDFHYVDIILNRKKSSCKICGGEFIGKVALIRLSTALI